MTTRMFHFSSSADTNTIHSLFLFRTSDVRFMWGPFASAYRPSVCISVPRLDLNVTFSSDPCVKPLSCYGGCSRTVPETGRDFRRPFGMIRAFRKQPTFTTFRRIVRRETPAEVTEWIWSTWSTECGDTAQLHLMWSDWTMLTSNENTTVQQHQPPACECVSKDVFT